MIDEIINLKELRKYITTEYGKRCGGLQEELCAVCKAWRKYDYIAEFVKDNKSLERWEKKYASED